MPLARLGRPRFLTWLRCVRNEIRLSNLISHGAGGNQHVGFPPVRNLLQGCQGLSPVNAGLWLASVLLPPSSYFVILLALY
jgi:hypothetical protein